jgi:hypothetical protein
MGVSDFAVHLADVRACRRRVFTAGTSIPQILAGLNSPDGWHLKDYEARDGYKALAQDHRREADARAGDRRSEGLGAARPRRRGLPDRPEVELHAASVPGQKYLVCNSDEGEPGTFKDRDILRYNPHIVIEGMAIAAYAMGITVGYNYIHGEIFETYQRFEAALEEATGGRPSSATTSWARTSRSSCMRSTASVRTSAAKRPRCSSRSRARRASRASSRRSRPASACTASRPRSTTPRPSPRCPGSSATAGQVPGLRQAEQRRHQGVLGVGRRQAAGQLRGPAGHAVREAARARRRACAAAASSRW